MQEIKEEVKQLLMQSGYTEEHFLNDEVNFSVILKLYKKRGFQLDEEFIAFLRVLSGKTLTYRVKGELQKADFEIKKVLNDLSKLVMRSYENKHQLKSLVPFGQIYNEHMTLIKDEDNKVYGIYDSLVILYGNSLWEGIENICKGKEIRTISE